MGRITIFSLDDCPHCVRTCNALTHRRIPYMEISLTKYPKKRKDMLSLSNRLTVPQVFINEAYIGGSDETLKLLEQWDHNSEGLSARKMYERLVVNAALPTDSRLQPSTDQPMLEHPPPPRDLYTIQVPLRVIGEPEKPMSVLQITELLKLLLPRQDLCYNLTVYKKAFTGASLVTALSTKFSIPRFDALNFARTLQVSHELYHHVVHDHIIQDTKNLFFRLQCDQTPHILNSYCVWSERVDPDAMALLERLKKRLNAVLQDHTTTTGKIDYIAAVHHEDFPALEEAICELQAVDYERMHYRLKLAFSINLYNLMIKYAFIKVGVGAKSSTRNAFFNRVAFQLGSSRGVGSYLLSFHDLENGILRGNRKAPFALRRPFSNDDSRLSLVMPRVDNRIHFALNCGASSCPPVINFTADGVLEELRVVARAFCEDVANVDVDGSTLYLSKIFYWYNEDFGGTPMHIAESVLGFLKGSEKAAKLSLLVASGNMRVKYNTYDWSSDASQYLSFSGEVIKADTSRLVILE
jgi:glutaredoxin